MSSFTPSRGLLAGCSRYITPREMLLMRRFCRLRRYGWLTRLFLAMTRLGDGYLWWSTGLALLAVGGDPGRRATEAMALAIAASVLTFKLIKGLIGRPRPFVAWPALTCLLAPPDRFSFPSGHTMTAFAAWAACQGLLPGSGPVILPVAVLIGLSRVFLGLHYPTDVLVGALLGSGLGLAAGHTLGLF